MNRRTKILKNEEDFIPQKRIENKKKLDLAKPTRNEKDELFRSGYECLDKLETNISKVTAEDSPLVSMVSGVSCDSIKNIISYKRKKLCSCSNVPQKAKTDADSKISIIVPPDKSKFYFAKPQKIPYYNGKLNESNIRILNQRYSFFLPVLVWTEYKFLYIVLS